MGVLVLIIIVLFYNALLGLLLICTLCLAVIIEKLRGILASLELLRDELKSTKKMIASAALILSTYTQLRLGQDIATKRGDKQQGSPF